MKTFIATMLLAGGLLSHAPAAFAEDLAVIVTNEFYRNHSRARDARVVGNLDANFRNAGFSVQRFENTQSRFGDSDAHTLLRRMNQAERLVVVISGHVVRANGAGWLLHTDAGRVNAFTIGREGLPIDAFLAVAARKQGDAVVAIATISQDLNLGFGVNTGYQPRDVPQGVTVLSGAPRQVGDFIANQLLVPGRNLAVAAQGAPDGLRVEGFLPQSGSFLTERTFTPDLNTREESAWLFAQSNNSVESYQGFLNQYPNGQFANEARQRLNALQLTPQDRARIEEENLGLVRDQRRSIQRNLTLIGYDTFGVDGIFGNRTRTAIANWQRDIGVQRTGYLNANQISRIEVAAATRAEQLRREAEQRRQIEERQDRQYWQQTGATGTEDGLHAYLQRYPDGLYSEQAVEALREIERQQRRLARAAEREAWDTAVMQGTLESYQQYLDQYPDGRFAQEAQARVQSLSNPETPPHIVAAAKQEEARMNLNGVTRKLIEFQLQASNLDPGRVDGDFTQQTRRAIRQFQRGNSLVVTGFITKDTIVLLLAAAVGR